MNVLIHDVVTTNRFENELDIPRTYEGLVGIGTDYEAMSIIRRRTDINEETPSTGVEYLPIFGRLHVTVRGNCCGRDSNRAKC